MARRLTCREGSGQQIPTVEMLRPLQKLLRIFNVERMGILHFRWLIPVDWNHDRRPGSGAR